MKLSTIQLEPSKSLAYMERYVNDGSPSGFSFTHTSSPLTEPTGYTIGFPLLEFMPNTGVHVHNLGALPEGLFSQETVSDFAMLVHPDMEDERNLLYLGRSASKRTLFLVQPTSSARTLEVINGACMGYLKLHYENHLGRIRRRLTLKHAQSAMENTQILDYLVARNLMPDTFAYYPEVGARIYEKESQESTVYWGMVWRPSNIRGTGADKVRYQIPGFSLFSRDMREPDDRTILAQICDIYGEGNVKKVIDTMLIPLLDSYFAMLMNGGLQGEWHAQNVLFGFDENWNCVATILRDMESVDRDIDFISTSGHNMQLESFPYKCVERGPNYAIRHSFMFDYKFGLYLLAPMVDHAAECCGVDASVIEREIIDFVMEKLVLLPDDFFPENGCWYSFAKQLIDQDIPDRPYVCNERPRFRQRQVVM